MAMGCTISPSLFVLTMKILPKVNIPETPIGKGVVMSPIMAFMGDTTMKREKVFQNTLDELNVLL